MLSQRIASSQASSGVFVADGYGIRIHVLHRHLVIADGYGTQRRETSFHRATHGLSRLVLLGHTGYVSLEALRWIHDARLVLIHIDRDGRVLTTGDLGVDQPALRRAQAYATTSPIGLELTRWMLGRKIAGQARVAGACDQTVADLIAGHVDQLDQVAAPDELRMVEASAAAAYWNLWAERPVRFPKRDQDRIPEHWKRVGPRRSPISGSGPRGAVSPAHALFNYLYALLEAEARIACLAVGLDPGIGILHADLRDRDSLALDVMEMVRPDVDTYVARLLTERTFSRDDFHETPRGGCRILEPLTHELATTTRTWARQLAPVVEHISRRLHPTARTARVSLTPLTQTNKRNARDPQRRQPADTTTRATPLPARRCDECGRQLRKGQNCPECQDRYIRDPNHPRLTTLANLRARGDDPAHGGQAAAKRGASTKRELARSLDWERNNPMPDPAIFTRHILPLLADVSVGDLARATGLSAGYCSMIKRGRQIPHPRHWDVLARISEPGLEPGG